MKQAFLLTALLLGFGTSSFGNVAPPTQETLSRALQQARRVASMENDHDLPSRAVWLGQRAAKNSAKLALKDLSKTKKKPRAPIQN
jgi:hypothetical protein